ncbi:MAG: helix-turn-helix domain-containing protein [Cyanobacteriota bacterium]
MTGNLALKSDQFKHYSYQHIQGVMLVTLNRLALDLNLSHFEYRLVATLISFWNKKQGVAFPSTRLLAEHCKMSNTTVSKGLKKLSQLGLIKIFKHPQNNRHNYYLNLDLLFPQKETTPATPCKTTHDIKLMQTKTDKEKTSCRVNYLFPVKQISFYDDSFSIFLQNNSCNNIDRHRRSLKGNENYFR